MRIPPATLEGERVVLRMPAPKDAGPYVQAFADDPDLAHHMGFDAPSVATMRKRLRDEARERYQGDAARFAIDDADGFAGLILLHTFDWAHLRGELGLMLVPRARGRGAALESMRLLVRWAFDVLGLQRVGLHTLPDNAAMRGLAERAGFTHEGLLHAYTREWGKPVDNVVYGIWQG